MKHITTILFLLVNFNTLVYGQILKAPISITSIITPPYSPYLNDYYQIGGTKLLSILTFNDFSEPQWEVRLHIKIEGDNGVVLQTKTGFMPISSIVLTPGVPFQVKGEEWATYFNYNNLDIQGVNPVAFTQNGLLPEGFYTISVQALDYTSGKLISNTSQISAMITLGGVPQVIQPSNNYVLPANPQNINFQWILSAPALNPQNTEYQLKLYEITSDDIAPEAALVNKNVVDFYTSDWGPNNFFVYDASATTLNVGKKYAYTIQVRDKEKKNMFKDKGMSEQFWFLYGYPVGGSIALSIPKNEYQFAKEEKQYFKWEVPDNKATPSQPIQYKYKIVKLNNKDEDLKSAIKTKEPFFEKLTDETVSSSSWGIEIEKPLEKEAWYAWKVEAYSGEQKIAESEIQKVQGPTLIDAFQAGDHNVIVVKTENNDLKDLKGIARIKLSADGKKTIDVPFEHLKLENAGDIYVLIGGKIEAETQDIKPIVIKAMNPDLPSADFKPNAIRLDRNSLEIRGNAQIPVPIPIDGDNAFVKIKNQWMNFDNFIIFGAMPVSAKFNLMEPLNFAIQLDTTSMMIIGNKGYQFAFYGHVLLPTSIKNTKNNRLKFPFSNVTKLDYFVIDESKQDVQLQEYRPAPKLNMVVKPQRVIVDFSDQKSPSTKDKAWKGVYVQKYKITFRDSLDKKGHIVFYHPFSDEVEVMAGGEDKNIINSRGLQFYRYQDFKGAIKTIFNSFPAGIDFFEINIENNSIKKSKLMGGVLIPILNPNKKFTFSIAITDDGLQNGILNKKLEGININFKGENPVHFQVKKAIFKKDFLDMTVDINIPKIHAKTTNVPNFRAYGDYQIGFGSKNGAQSFDKQITGKYNNLFELTIDTIGAAFLYGKYIAYYSAALSIDDGISGADGPPRINMLATTKVDDDLTITTDNKQNPPPIKLPVNSYQQEKIPANDSIYIEIKTPTVEVSGNINLEQDQKWGNVFQGRLKGAFLVPAKIDAGFDFTLGKKDDFTYWFFDMYATTQDKGIPLTPLPISIVGLEGRVFRHMSAQMDKKTKKVKISIDKSVEFGAGLYMQLIDEPNTGRILKTDLGVEMTYKKGDFTINMQGEATILNAKAHTASPTGAVASGLTKEANKKAAEEAVKWINKQTIQAGDWSFKPNIKIEGAEKSGGLEAVNGTTKVGIGAVISGKTPLGYFKFANSDWDIAVEANPWLKSGGFSIKKLGTPYIAASLEYIYKDKASIAFTYDKLKLAGEYSQINKEGKFTMGYDDTQVSIWGSKVNKIGKIDFSYNDFEILATANMQKQEANFKLAFDNKSLDLYGNKTGSGKMKYRFDANDSLLIQFDKPNKAAIFAFKNSDIDILAKGSTQEGNISLKNSNFALQIATNRVKKTGSLNLELSKKQKYSFNINTAKNTGQLNIVYDNMEYGIGTGKTSSEVWLKAKQSSTDYIYTNVNLATQTGAFSSSFGKNKFQATLAKDSATIYYKINDMAMLASANRNYSGLVALKIKNDSLRLFGDRAGRGNLYFKHDNLLINIGGDRNTGSGKFLYKLANDSISISANRDAKTASIHTAFGDNYFGAWLTPNQRGYLSYKNPNLSLALGGGAGYGKLLYKEPSKMFFIESDAQNATHILNLKVNNDSIYVFLNTDSILFSTNLNNNYLSAYHNNMESGMKFKNTDFNTAIVSNLKNKFRINYADNQNKISVYANSQNHSGGFKLKIANDSISADIAGGRKEATLNYQNFIITAIADPHKSNYLNIKKADWNLSMESEGENFATISFKNDDNEFAIAANKQKETAKLKLKIKQDSIDIDLDKTGNNIISMTYQQNLLQTKYSSTGDKQFRTKYQDNEIDLFYGNAQKYVAFSNKKISLKASNDLKTTLKYKNKVYEFDANEPNILLVDGQKKYLVLDKNGNGSMLINVKGLNIEARVNSGTKTLSIQSKKLPKVTVGFDKNNKKFAQTQIFSQKIKLQELKDGASLTSNEKQMSYSQSKGFYIRYAKDIQVSINNQQEVNAQYKSASAEFKSTSDFQMTYDKYSILVKPTKIELNAQDKKIYLDTDSNLVLQLAENQKINLSPQKATLVYKDIEFSLDKNSELIFKKDKYKLKASTKIIEVTAGQLTTSLSSDLTLNVKEGKNKSLLISSKKAQAQWDNYKLSLVGDSSLNITDGQRTLQYNNGNLELKQDGKRLAISKDRKITIELDSNKFEVSKTDLNCKYQNYSAGIGVTDGIWFSDGTRGAKINKKLLKLQLGTRSVSYITDKQQIELVDGKIQSATATPKSISYTREGKTLTLGGKDILKYQDKQQTFVLGNDINIKQDGYNISMLNLKTNSPSFLIAKDKYKVSYSKKNGFRANFQNDYVGIGGDKYIDAKIEKAYLLARNDNLAFTYDNKGASIGGKNFISILYDKSEISFTKKYELAFLDHSSAATKGLKFNSIGEITLINGKQQIIAGGTEPIKFTGGDLGTETNSDGGFSLNVAGADIDVIPTSDNNVEIKTSGSFGDINVKSMGQGQMEASLYRDKKFYAKLYKNQYTWGLSFDENFNTSGPQTLEEDLNGPSHIGYITHNSTSVMQVKIAASYSTGKKTFTASGQATGTLPLLCMNNVKFAMKFAPKNDWYIKVADREEGKWASIRPLCLDIGGHLSGYFYMDPNEIAIGAGYRYKNSLNATADGFGFKTRVNFGISGETSIDPNKISINYLTVKADAAVSIDVCGGMLGCTEIASAGIKGKLNLILTEKEKSIYGKLNAHVSVLGQGVNVGFNAKTNL